MNALMNLMWPIFGAVALRSAGIGLALSLALGRTPFPDRASPLFFGAGAVAFLSLVGSLGNTLRKPGRDQRHLILGLVAVTFIGTTIAIARGAATGYSQEKTLASLLVTLPVLILASQLSKKDLGLFRDAFIGIALVLAAVSLVAPTDVGQGERAAALGGGPIVLAQFCAISILLLLSRPLLAGSTITRRSVKASVLQRALPIALLGFTIFRTEARMPLIALIIALFVMFRPRAGQLRTGSNKSRLLGLGTCSVLLGYLVNEVRSGSSRLSLIKDPLAELERSRLPAWRGGVELIDQHFPIGGGFGSYVEIDARLRYPHNLGLELVGEAGLVGLAFAAVVAISAVRIFRSAPPEWSAITIFLVFATQFSGDLYNSRLLFAFAIVALGEVHRDHELPHSTNGFRTRNELNSKTPQDPVFT